MAKDSVSYDTLQRLHFGRYSGERLLDCPPAYLRWLCCFASKIGPKLQRSAAAALMVQTRQKINQLFGPLESRHAFPQPPDGWESAGSS